MKLRIGFDAKRLFHNYTGLGNFSRTLVSNLRKMHGDCDYVLFAARTSTNAEAIEFLSDSYRVVTPSGRNFLWRHIGICKDIKAENIDIFHGLSHDLPFGIERSGAKSVVTIHDVCYKTFPSMFSVTERMLYAIKYNHSLRVADKVIAISQSTKDDILRFFGASIPGLEAKTEVVYQAINPVFYEQFSMDEARHIVKKYGLPSRYLLYVGSINSRKNLLGVIRAYAQIDVGERVPLVVVGCGDGKYAKMCYDEINNLALGQYIIRIEGVSSMVTLRAFYGCALGVVYPSFYEGFGLPVTEALLCGTPVITSLVSSLPEAGGEAAFYVDPNNGHQIASAITKVLTISDDERVELGQKGRLWALEKFDPAKLTAQMHQLYEKLLK